MIALTRMRTIAALCALLCFLTASALAGQPSRPIDRPDGSPEPGTTEIGDPDQPSGSMVVILYRWIYVYRLPLGGIRRATPTTTIMRPAVGRPVRPALRVQNARRIP